jgi:RimJ/RimL family protein N-acetyltransferase
VPFSDDRAAGFVPVLDDRPADAAWGALVWPPPASPLAGRFVELWPLDLDADVDALFAAVDHDEVWRHVAGRPSSAAGYKMTLRRQLDQGRLPWVVRLVRPVAGLPAGSVVGTSSYLEASVPDARLEIGSTSYTPAVWGSVVNPEVKLLLLGLAFDTLGAGRVQLKTDVRNVRSQRAIARLGARYEGTLRRYQRRTDGTVRDSVLFSVVAEEWPRVRAGLVERVAAVAD